MDPKSRNNEISTINLKLNSPKYIDDDMGNKLNSNINTKSEEFKGKKVNFIN